MASMACLQSPPPGRLIVDMSTISPVAVRRIHADLKQANVSFIDAPVSGGPIGAKNAALSIMAGGEAEAFARAEPFFRAMGTTINHVGAAGAGQAVKLCNQLICGINIQAICEAIALGRASGVDLDQLRKVLLGGSAASWMLDKLGPAMIDRRCRRRLPHRSDAQGSSASCRNRPRRFLCPCPEPRWSPASMSRHVPMAKAPMAIRRCSASMTA